MSNKGLAMHIVQKLRSAGHTAYFAGGWVRDYLLKLPHDDIDVATSATPEQVQELFEKTILVGAQFGVVIVPLEGVAFEVASFRKEGLYVDGRRPETVEYATPEEDAERRDFTINGMFFDPMTEEVIDFVGGQEDLQRGIVRAIGNASERFEEDRLRMIRAIRFAACLGFHLCEETRVAIAQQASTLFPAVSIERVWQEFQKLGGYPAFGIAIVEMHRLGLLQEIFPELSDVSLEEMQERVAVYENFPENCPTALYLCELFPGGTVEHLCELLNKLRAPNRTIRWVEYTNTVREAVEREASGINTPELVEWARIYADPRSFIALEVVAARKRTFSLLLAHQERAQQLAPHIQRMHQRRPLIGSQDLRKLGIEPGKKMGDILKEAERLAVNYNYHDPAELMAELQRRPCWSIP